jgi:hypothetical protein
LVRASQPRNQAAKSEKEDAVFTNLRKKHAFLREPSIIACMDRFVTG